MYTLLYSPKAQKAICKFPQEYQRLILKKLLILQDNPRPRGFDKIATRTPPLYRLRIGDYRIFYFIDDEKLRVIVVDVERRTTQTYRRR